MANELWAVEMDPNDHGEGWLLAEGASSPQTVKIGPSKRNAIVHESPAFPDLYGHDVPLVNTKTHSGTVFCYGSPVHRQSDERKCGAFTIVKGQSTVFVGD